MMVLFQLISSLPMLRIFEKPAIAHEEFMAVCAHYIHGEDFKILESFSLYPGEPAFRHWDADAADSLHDGFNPNFFPEKSLARAYARFETGLRHSLMKLRLAQLDPGFEGPKAGQTIFDVEADKIAHAAMLIKNPLERERMLDRARWTKLEELEQNQRHVFHFDTVCAYSMKLQIAEKWVDRIPGRQAEANLTEAATRVSETLQRR